MAVALEVPEPVFPSGDADVSVCGTGLSGFAASNADAATADVLEARSSASQCGDSAWSPTVQGKPARDCRPIGTCTQVPPERAQSCLADEEVFEAGQEPF